MKKWLIGTAVSIGLIVMLLFSVMMAAAGSDDSGSSDDTATDGVYNPAMIKACAKAMDADPTDEFISDLEQVIKNESGGNASIVQQITDVNSGGNEAAGLLQYTAGTFANYALEGHTNRMNAVDQLLAFFNNSQWQTSIGMTTIWGVDKMEWLHSGPQGTRRFTKIPGTLDLSGIGTSGSAGDITLSSASNPYPSGQCTWWAKARSGWAGNGWGNGCQWGISAAAAGYTVNHTPAAGALVSFAAGQTVGNWQADPQYGHVAYVEKYDSSKGTITISQGGTGFKQQPGPNLQTISNVTSFIYIHKK